MKSSISVDMSSSGEYNESVSSSVGGFISSFADLKAGMAAMANPPVAESTAIVMKPSARLQKGRLVGIGWAIPIMEVVSICFVATRSNQPSAIRSLLAV